MILEIDGIHTYYGSSHVLFELSLRVEEGEIVVLLGRNGAGKTTTLRSIVGIPAPRSGSIRFRGQEIAGEAPYNVARRGIAFIPDTRRVFPDLSVRDNLEIGAHAPRDGSSGWTVERVYTLFPLLRDLDGRDGRYLSGGEQQMLAIGRALMSNPKVLMLDEPSLGLAPILAKSVLKTVREIANRGAAVLLVEQNARQALAIADHAYVIEVGRIVLEGGAAVLAKDERVQKAYLGGFESVGSA